MCWTSNGKNVDVNQTFAYYGNNFTCYTKHHSKCDNTICDLATVYFENKITRGKYIQKI